MVVKILVSTNCTGVKAPDEADRQHRGLTALRVTFNGLVAWLGGSKMPTADLNLSDN